MESENMRDLIWLDEAFSKGVVDDIEAACCLAGYSENEIRISSNVPNIHRLYPIDIYHPIVSKIYGIIMSWRNITRCKPLLWYIEQAVVRNTPYVRFDLLLPKCTENEYRQKECIDNYPLLVKKLDLAGLLLPITKDDGQTAQSPEINEIPWRKCAVEIYKELKLEKKKMSVEKKAKIVEAEMKKRHAQGVKGMTKRGGKDVPDFQSIRRLALNVF